MPRHNFHKVAPLVKSLCAKYGIEYQEKPLLRALQDIIRSEGAVRWCRGCRGPWGTGRDWEACSWDRAC